MKKSSVTSDRKTSVYQLRQLVQNFVDERDWRKYHNPKDLTISIAIEAAELMELFQWVSREGSGESAGRGRKVYQVGRRTG